MSCHLSPVSPLLTTVYLDNVQESITAKACYSSDKVHENTRVTTTMGAGTGAAPGQAPPDLPSLLLDGRICYIGMPVSLSDGLACVWPVLAIVLTFCIYVMHIVSVSIWSRLVQWDTIWMTVCKLNVSWGARYFVMVADAW